MATIKVSREITSYDLNKSYTIAHHKAGVRVDTVFTFDPVGSGTRVSMELGLNPQGLPPALLLPLEWAISSKVRDVLDKDLLDLKQAVEEAAKP